MKTTHLNQLIQEVKWISKKRSQNYVAAKAQVSTAIISKMVNGDLSQISDSLLNKIQSNLKIDPNWNIAITDNLEGLYNCCRDAQLDSLLLCISDKAGKGKTNAFEYYDRKNNNVFHIECQKTWTQKVFVKQLLITLGKKPQGTTWQMLEQFDKEIRNIENGLLIIDQADHLKEPQFNMIMDFSNDYKGRLGIIISGVKHLERKMRAGVLKEKGSYDELESRFGRTYIELNPVSLKDVTKICFANGVENPSQIQTIYDTCGGDLRRVKRDVQKIKIGQRPRIKLAS